MSIIAMVIGGVVLGIKKMVGNKLSPNAKYLLWLVFLATLLFPIAVPSRISIYNLIDISDVKEVKDTEVENMMSLWKNENNNAVISKDTLDNIITNNNKMLKVHFGKFVAFTWFTVFVILLIKRMYSYFSMHKKVGKIQVENKRVISILENCKKKLHIHKPIKLIKQDCTFMPSTIGIFNVKILVFDSFLEMDDVSITNVFMHELSHYKRKDNVVNFMILIIKSLHWFNPILNIMFKNIREEMELATDEIAISKMNGEERIAYCNSLIKFSTNSNIEFESILGLSKTAKTLSTRVKAISAKNDFDKKSKLIFSITILIMILMCLILYPTSYGMFETPKLYLQLENGEKIEITQVTENMAINEIKLTQNDKVKLMVKGAKSNDYVFYKRVSLDVTEPSEEIANLMDSKRTYFERGKAIYKFTLTYGNNKSADYAIKIEVE